MAHVLILAATSTLGRALCRGLAARGFALSITGRDEGKLQALQADLTARYQVPVGYFTADLERADYDPAALVAQVTASGGAVTHLVTLPGLIGRDVQRVTQVNYTGVAALIEAVWPMMKQAGNGTIVVISSIAGERGRGSNYIYGAAKAALTTYADGLRHHLRDTPLHVMTVKPGFIDSPMTFGQNLPLVAAPDAVAQHILRAMDRGATTLYTPWFWRWIMLIIRNIPEPIFRKLPL